MREGGTDRDRERQADRERGGKSSFKQNEISQRETEERQTIRSSGRQGLICKHT